MHNDIEQQVIAVIKYSKIYGKGVETGRTQKPGYQLILLFTQEIDLYVKLHNIRS